MLAYNSILKCAANGRVAVFPSVWKKPSSFSRFGFSTAPLVTLLAPARKPLSLTLVLSPSVKRNIHISKCLLNESASSLAKDVILFKFDNTRLFKIITLFGFVNFTMFMSISLNIYSLVSKQAVSDEEKVSDFDSETSQSSALSPESESYSSIRQDRSWMANLLSRDTDGSMGPISATTILTGLCGVTFVLGYMLLGGVWMYCNNSVRYLVLRKSGKQVTVITHGLFGINRYRTFNLNEVSVRGNRAISSAVLLNAKGKYFSYIIDKRGTYTNPQLFDATVAVPRSLK